MQKWTSALKRSWEIRKSLDEPNITVILAWIPGHCGVVFNELADKAAKEGCYLSRNTESVEMPYSTIVKGIKILIRREWQDSWIRCETGVFTKDIVPSIDTTNKTKRKKLCYLMDKMSSQQCCCVR